MLHEFAIEPAAVRSWDRLQFFLSNFGVRHGRLISRYPKRWAALVRDGLTACRPAEKLRIVEALKRAADRRDVFCSRHHEWKDTALWLDQAEEEHSKRPFWAIIATRNPRDNPSVLLDDIDVTNPPEAWKVYPTKQIERKAAAMADLVGKLLRMAKTILFVDRNFDPKRRKCVEPLGAFLRATLDQHAKCQATRVEVHSGNAVHHPDDFKRLCQGLASDAIPAGIRVRFIRWAYGELHNRYILTDIGGVSFGQGLDQAGDTDQQLDTVSLVDAALAVQLLDQFIGPKPTFTADGTEITVLGT